jgi:hypothetical protein
MNQATTILTCSGQADGTVQAIAVSENSPTCGTFIIPMRYARRVSFQFR